MHGNVNMEKVKAKRQPKTKRKDWGVKLNRRRLRKFKRHTQERMLSYGQTT
jgi:hypothetical protein